MYCRSRIARAIIIDSTAAAAQAPYHACVDALPPYCGGRRSEDYFSSPPPRFWFDVYGVPWTPVLPDGGCRGGSLVGGSGGGGATQPQMSRT
ncbi:hypothetical protein DL765_009541 [Monosporascus sp. GIB2]|nr:hypothetical protein DL765_009541 [Monosporascus sp. GIB2]